MLYQLKMWQVEEVIKTWIIFNGSSLTLLLKINYLHYGAVHFTWTMLCFCEVNGQIYVNNQLCIHSADQEHYYVFLKKEKEKGTLLCKLFEKNTNVVALCHALLDVLIVCSSLCFRVNYMLDHILQKWLQMIFEV